MEQLTGRASSPPPPPPTTEPSDRAVTRATLYAPAVTFLIPFFGAFVALASPGFGAMNARGAWRTSRANGAVAGILVLAILWLPAIAIFAPVPLLDADWHVYRIIPLCGPATGLAWFLPGLVAILMYAGGVVLSQRWRSPWLWPAGALVATGAYHLVWVALKSMGHGLVC